MSAQTPPCLQADPTQLHRHLAQCVRARGSLHTLHCAAESLGGILTPRLMCCVAVLALLLLI